MFSCERYCYYTRQFSSVQVAKPQDFRRVKSLFFVHNSKFALSKLYIVYRGCIYAVLSVKTSGVLLPGVVRRFFKADQDHVKEALGAEYTDHNLVVAGPLGLPAKHITVNTALNCLIKRNDLSKVVFYSVFWSCSHCNHRPGMVL